MMGILFYFIGVLMILNFLEVMSLYYSIIFFFFFFYMFMYFIINMKFYNFWILINHGFGFDKISLMLILMLIWLIILMLLSVMNLDTYYLNFFIIQLLLMMLSLIYFFSSMNLLSFYIFFEFSLIPVLMMILGWGVQPERLQAGIYMMIYTMFGSLPYFVLLIFLLMNYGSLNMMYLIFFNYDFFNSIFIYFFLMIIFLIKLPIYMFHLWLPKAHVEAPVFGSMVLAGVMLKLGGYGIFRMMFFFGLMMKYNLYFIIFIIIGSLNISIICVRQVDMKMLIAYSSIVHMGFMIVGVLMMYYTCYMGGLMMMIGHGLCSSGLFCLMNFNYKRFGSRMFLINKGSIQFFCSMSLWWFFFCMINMSCPPSLNMFSEFLLIMLMLKYYYPMFILIMLIIFFGSIFSLYLFSFSQHGNNLMFYFESNYNTVDEYLLMFLHYIPLNFFFLLMNFF